jgi:hypothetical protein
MERRRSVHKVGQCVICGSDIGGGTITSCNITHLPQPRSNFS